MWRSTKQTVKKLFVCTLILLLFLSGFPSKDFFTFAKDALRDRNVIDSLYLALHDTNVIDRNAQLLLNSPVPKASAATFQMNSGYYVGNGGVKTISGLGFRPEMIVLKSNTNSVATVFHTNVMPDNVAAYAGTATADSTAGFVRIEADGFKVYSSANIVNVRYTWIAFAGSDCSASGTMCIGSYVGNGASNQAITSVGFQPDLVWTKRTTNERSATWRSSSMPSNHGQYLSATTQDTTGALFQTLDATGFTVGLSNNTSTGIYYYVAFKEVSGFMDVGTYTGNATDNRSITGVGFKPDWVFLKNANAGTAVAGVHSQRESYGDSTAYMTNTANLTDSIQALENDGFQVGAHSTANGSGDTLYYAAFKGVPSVSSSGAFKMASGSYTADGTIQIIEGLEFKPDLVIIKGETTQAGVFRTSLMGGNSTAYLDAATSNFAGGITALNHDGFTIGDHATVNTIGVTYHWQAFGGAWNPETKSGASDFYIGAYYGNTIDNRNITELPFQADLLVIKRFGTSAGVFRTSAHTGDDSSFFAATANTSNHIQAINSDGFQVGNPSNTINTAGQMYFYFGFKEGTDFDVGTYTGDNVDDRDITAPGFDPNLAWIKRSTAVAGVTRPSTLSGDLTQYFITTAQAAGRIKSFVTGGFRLGTQTEVNASGGTYYYATWDVNSTQDYEPADYAMKTGYYMGTGTHQEITGLGFRPEMIILKSNTTAGVGALYKTEHMPESAVNGLSTNSSGSPLTETSGYEITFLADGFRVAGTNANSANVGYVWMAFAGSNCTTTGVMCTGSYVGTYNNSIAGIYPWGRKLYTGFRPSFLFAAPKSGSGYTTNQNIPQQASLAFEAGASSRTDIFLPTNQMSISLFSANLNDTINYFFAFAGQSGTFEAPSYEWTRAFGVALNSIYGTSVAVDSSENVYVTGLFNSTVDFDDTGGTDTVVATGQDSFITKYNADGSYGWTRGLLGLGIATIYGAATDSSGNIFLTGSFSSTVDFDGTSGTDNNSPSGTEDIFITKYNADGSYGWTRTFGNANANENSYSAATDSSGNIYITGRFSGTVDFDDTGGTDNHTSNAGSGSNVYVTKYNADGSYGWTRTFGSTTGDLGTGITIDSSGNIFITGLFYSSADFDFTAGTDTKTSGGANTDFFITKHNADGSYGWTRTFGSTSSNEAHPSFDIDTDSSGNVYITGSFTGTVDFDDTGGTDNQTPYNSTDGFITKYNADGSYGWTKPIGLNSNDYGTSITINSNDDIFVLSKGNAGRAITQLNNSDGTFKSTTLVPDTRSSAPSWIDSNSIESNGSAVYTTGAFSGTRNFDDTGGTDIKVATGSQDAFIVKYDFGSTTYSAGYNTNITSGTYTGDGTTRNITSLGFNPDVVFVKGDNGSAYGLFNTKYSYGNNSFYFYDAVNLVGAITDLITDGFQVANNVNANQNTVNYYYTAFKETGPATPASGSFSMDSGTYTGNGAYQRIGGLSGQPDMVIIKGETTQQAVFRTKVMSANSTAYVGAATANLSGAITSLNHDGFNVGNSATVNSAGVTYHYQAFYNAYDGLDHAGAADFALGHYYGNGINDRNIDTVPFEPDLVWTKRSGSSAGAFRTSAHTGDLSSFFINTADAADIIQSFATNGFQIGTNASVNTAANNYWWVAFKEGTGFDVGTFTGDSVDNRDITDPAHTPDLVWIKRSTAINGVFKPSSLAGDNTLYFNNVAQVSGRIKDLIANGFRLGTQTEANASGGSYYFASWSGTGSITSTLTQVAYRFFENTDTTDVGTALDAQNTPATLDNAGDAFRLRLLLAVDDANLALDGETLKLQFVDKGAGSCASPSGGTPSAYTDVTDATVIAYNDNATPTDGAALTANANDPTDGGRTIVNQSYQELNNFTNDEAAINDGQDGKWDFPLVDNGADPDTTFCFRVVKSDGTPLDTYTEYPEITTADGSQSLTFSISDNTVGFGTLSASGARYATGDTTGSNSDTTDAHTISVAANAAGDYVLTINGETLTCDACGGSTIDAIGGVAAASAVGTEQFGLRLTVNSGTGVSTAPYASSDWAFDDASLPDQVASGDGDGSTTEFGVRYIANTASVSSAGEYSAALTYTVTATY